MLAARPTSNLSEAAAELRPHRQPPIGGSAHIALTAGGGSERKGNVYNVMCTSEVNVNDLQNSPHLTSLLARLHSESATDASPEPRAQIVASRK